MKKIGCFRQEGAEWIGTIAVLQFEARARIIPAKNKLSSEMPDFILLKIGGTGGFDVELGTVWERYSTQQRIAYKAVTLDDPALSQAINAVLWEDPNNGYWYLYWDRHSAGEYLAERLYAQEEPKPQLGICPITRITPTLETFYPDLVPG